MRYWGRHFPDAFGRLSSTPATHAELALDPITSGAGPRDAIVRAIAEGPVSIKVAFVNDAATSNGTITEGPSGGFTVVTVHFLANSTTMEQLRILFTAVTSVELVGTWDALQVLVSGDAFSETALTGGLTAGSQRRQGYWGRHFPDLQSLPNVVFAPGPSGVDTLALALESGLTLSLSWANGVFESYGNYEKRTSGLKNPRQMISGEILLQGDARADIRAVLRKYAMLGEPFLLGLPHEGVPLKADSNGVLVTPARVDLEWMAAGQRVMCLGKDETFVVRTVQDVIGSTVQLDTAPGTPGDYGGSFMPVVAVLLDPQQSFTRYPVQTERWGVVARLIPFAWSRAARVTAPTIPGLVFTSRVVGDFGNIVEVRLSISASPGVTLDESDTELNIIAQDSVSTVNDVVAALANSQLVRASGSYTGSTIIDSSKTFGNTALVGGGDYDVGELTASIATFQGRPVWDRRIQVDESIDDFMHARTELLDLSGQAFQGGEADAPAWGRGIRIKRTGIDEYLWLRGFLHATRGQQIAFWLPTWRDGGDLRATADYVGSNQITIDATFGDFRSWQSSISDLLIRQGGSYRYCHISGITDNGSTFTLTLSGDTLTAGPIHEIFWLELCRFEKDSFDISFSGPQFEFETLARVVIR